MMINRFKAVEFEVIDYFYGMLGINFNEKVQDMGNALEFKYNYTTLDVQESKGE